jgi:predicted RNase H-like HicB family nuclease
MEYTIRVIKDPKSGWFTGQCEQLPEAITQGKDLEELMLMMEDAIELVLECKRDEFFLPHCKCACSGAAELQIRQHEVKKLYQNCNLY